jgi:hypothetical protein
MQLVVIIGALLVAFVAPAADVLEVPFGQQQELQSPDHRHKLVLKPAADGANQPPELWLAPANQHDGRRILVINRTARAEWAPDAKKFYVADEAASDTTESRVYDTEGSVILDVRKTLLKADPLLAPWQNAGHLYIKTQGWIDANTLRVAWYGHTDGPVKCFTFEYSLSVTGSAARLSSRITNSTAREFCDENPE